MRPTIAAINHLLAQEPWAQSKLMAHSGKTACIDVGLAQWRLTVSGDGLLQQADANAVAAVTLHLQCADLPLIVANRERAVSYVRIEGDADFANVMAQLSQALRWDAEEDLSKIVGDIAATRIVSGVKAVMTAAQTAQKQFAENVAEYLVEEQPMLIQTHRMSEFSSDVVKLRDHVERLSKRIEKLERR